MHEYVYIKYYICTDPQQGDESGVVAQGTRLKGTQNQGVGLQFVDVGKH